MAHIQLAEHAKEDINRIEYNTIIYTGDVGKADQIVDGIIATIHSLSVDPMRCPFVRDDMLALLGFRWIESGVYYIFYIYDELASIIHVARVLHEKMDWQGILKGEPYID